MPSQTSAAGFKEHIWRAPKLKKHTSAAPITLNVQLSPTFFHSEHHQSCLSSEVIYFTNGHKGVQRVKRRKEKTRKVNKHKLLLSVFLLRWGCVNEALSPLATAAGKAGKPQPGPSRYQPSCTPIIPALPLILRGNVNTLMAAFSLQAVFTNTGCATVAPGACEGLISN